MPTAVIVLAAGQGTRMNSDLPKVLHPLGGVPLLAHALAAARGLEPARIVLVTGHGGEAVAAAGRAIDEDIRIVVQAEQKGTGHAVLQAAPALAGFEGDVVVLYADTPLIRPETLQAMLAARAGGAAVVVLGFEAADPGGYGRLITDAEGLAAIVEARDATPEQRAVRLCNSGLMAADAGLLLDAARRRSGRQRQGRILPDRRGGARPRPRADAPRRSPVRRRKRSGSTRAPTSRLPRRRSRPAPAPPRWRTARR